jgi:transketolase
MTNLELRRQALRIREHILAMASSPEGAHIGGAMSIADLLVVLYFCVLRIQPDDPQWVERDYFILSKGHACAALYATLAERGFFPVEELATYARPGSRLAGHPLRKVPGVEFPTGSLGHGLSLGAGLALAAQRDGRPNRSFVLLGDGELQEGSVWEAAMAAAHYALDNLVAIVDRNRLQISGPTEQYMRLEPLTDRWRGFGWGVVEVDGHDMQALSDLFAAMPMHPGRPSIVIAHTVKGRGIKSMEGRKKIHYARLNAVQYKKALAELYAAGE